MRPHYSGRIVRCPRCACENFLYGFKAALRAARAAASGRRVRAPASLPLGRPLTPGRLARKADRAAHHSSSPRAAGFDTGTPRGGSIGLMRPAWNAARSRTSVQPPPPCQIPLRSARSRAYPPLPALVGARTRQHFCRQEIVVGNLLVRL